MICENLLFTFLCLTVLGPIQIQCQEYEGLMEVWTEHWGCQPKGNGYDDETYGLRDYFCGYYEGMAFYYGFLSTPEPPIEVYPDFSCHPGFNMAEYTEMHEYNMNQLFAGPNTPTSESGSIQTQTGECPKFNMIYREYDSNTFDLLAFDVIKYGDATYDVNYVDGNRKYWFKDSSDRLNAMFGEELGGELMRKIKEECQPILHRVFFEEGHKCGDDEADQIYDCINNAVGC